MSRRRARGFTLLEVLVALAITGLAVGALFGLLGGSKRLSFASGDALAKALFQRAALNAAQVEEKPEYPEEPEREAWRAKMEVGELVPPPERQTKEILYALERFTVVNDRGEPLQETTRWKKLETAQ
ncbi:type II secretion system protein [Endothiovibrio diazotrophicus]